MPSPLQSRGYEIATTLSRDKKTRGQENRSASPQRRRHENTKARQHEEEWSTPHIKGTVGLEAGSQPPPGVYFIAPLYYADT
jgi:hypothetical protein